MWRLVLISLLLVSLVVLLWPAPQAEAIPAFARKYSLSCTTCHLVMPKLKDYGEQFAGNGFQLPDGEEPARAFVKTGDDDLLLQRDVPLAIRFDLFAQVADRNTAKFDLQTPYGIKLLSGGSISKRTSYYFYFFIDERGEVGGIEDAFVQFRKIGNRDFSLIAGQFQVSDPLFKRELRLSFEDYQIYRLRPGDSMANLTYDRGLMAVYGTDIGLDLVAQILNGNGIEPAENRLFDVDNEKTFSLRASQSLGPLRFGVFGYRGAEKNDAAVKNTIEIYGPDLTLARDKFEFNAQYLHREDDNPFFRAGQAQRVKADGGFAELLILPRGDRSRWLLHALYNRIDATGPEYDYETATVGLNHLAARNLRVLGEFTYDLISEKSRFTLGLVSAF